MASRAEQALQFFTGLGLTPQQAAGFVGNLQQESGQGLNPTALGDNGKSFGIAQFQGPRRQALNAFAAQRGTDPSDFQTQLEFIGTEFQTTERPAFNAIRGAQTPQEAARAGVKFFRPSDPRTENRIANAMRLAGVQPGSQVDAEGLLASETPSMANGPTQQQGGVNGLLSGALESPLLNLGIGLLAASGPSTTPVSLGQALAQGAQFAQTGQQQALKNQAVRAQLAEQARKQQLGQRFQGLLDDPNLNISEGTRRAAGLLAEAGDLNAATSLAFPQERADTSLVRNMKAAGIDPMSKEGQDIIRQNFAGRGTNEQLDQILKGLQIQSLQDERAKAKTEAERNQTEGKLSVIGGIERLKEVAQINDRLRGTMGESGLGFEELRSMAAGPITVLVEAFGGDTQKARQVAADMQRLDQLTTTEAVQSLFGGEVRAGTITDAKLGTFLQTKPGINKLPETNSLVIADMLQAKLDSATKLGVDLADREQVESLIKQLRGNSATGTKKRLKFDAQGNLVE